MPLECKSVRFPLVVSLKPFRFRFIALDSNALCCHFVHFSLTSLDGFGDEVEEAFSVLLRLHRADAVDARAVLDRLGHLGRLLLDTVVREYIDERQEVDLPSRGRVPGRNSVDVLLRVDLGAVCPGGGAVGERRVWRGEGDARASRIVLLVVELVARARVSSILVFGLAIVDAEEERVIHYVKVGKKIHIGG